MAMSRVFEAMRRLNAAVAKTPAATGDDLEGFVLEEVRPSPDEPNELPSPEATLWNEPTLRTGKPADLRPALENKRGSMPQSFSDLLREIARDEQEQGYE
jgi:hypothetical protein